MSFRRSEEVVLLNRVSTSARWVTKTACQSQNVNYFLSLKGRGGGGEPVSHRVYKSGRSFYISGPDFKEHLCHPSVTSREAIKREIYLVYKTKVTNIKMPWEL